MNYVGDLIHFSQKFLDNDKNEAFLRNLPEIEKELMGSFLLVSDDTLVHKKSPLSVEENAAKYRIIEKLKRHMLQYTPNPNKQRASQLAYYKIHLNFICFKYLIAKQYRPAAAHLALQTFRLAKKYKILDIATILARFLFRHYASHTKDQKLAKIYYAEVHELNRKVELEIKCEWYHAELTNQFSVSKDLGNEFKATAEKYYAEVSEQFSDPPSTNYLRFGYSIGVFYKLSQKDYQSTIHICKKARQNLMENKHLADPFGARLFLNYQAYAAMADGDLAHAKELLLEVRAGTEKYGSQWYTSMQYLLLIHLREGSYTQTRLILSEAKEGKLSRQTKLMKNRWEMFEAYHHLCIHLAGLESKFQSSFNISKFLNKVTELSQDKKGFNISLLVCKWLGNYIRNNYDRLIDQEEALNSYIGRYLRKNKTFRNNCFLRMLLSISKQQFHPEAVARHTEKYRVKLSLIPLAIDQSSDLVEIVPFEKLWDLILLHLMRNYKKENPKYVPRHIYLKSLMRNEILILKSDEDIPILKSQMN